MSLALQVALGVALGLTIFTAEMVAALLAVGYVLKLRRRRKGLPQPPQ